MADRPIVILAEPIEEAPRAWLADRVDLRELAPGDAGFDQALAVAHGIVIRTATRVDVDLLDAAPCLLAVARAGVGLDGIDQSACRERGIAVLNTPDANTQAVVEFVIASVTHALRPRDQVEEPLDRQQWQAMRASDRASIQMDQLTFGVLGFGRIGSRVGEVASAIGFRVLFHDLLDIPASRHGDAAPVGLEALLGESDVLSIHVDGRASNRHLLDSRRLELLRESVLLVNASRGFVIDEEALAAHLRATPSMHVILDVHDTEPIPPGSPMLGLPNATLHPHIAARTRTGLLNMGWVVRDLLEHVQVASRSPA